MILLYGKVKCINHLNFRESISDNLSNTNYYFITVLIVLFVFAYLFVNRDVVLTGIAQGMLGREPDALLESRRGITSNYLYTVIVYNILPFLTIVSLYKSIKKSTLYSRVSFLILFSISFFLILMLFQKRPLIIFMLSLLLAGYVFRGNLITKKTKTKVLSKRQKRRKYIIYLGFLFSLLLILYYSATTYQFQNLFEAILKLSEIVLTRVFGRLSIPAFMYTHYFSEVGGHYGFTNIGMLSSVFGFEHFEDTKTLYTYFSRSDKDGSLAINSIMDFYGGFGYPGLLVGNVMLGFLLAVLERVLNTLEKNNINMVFTIFCFVFAYYLSQASLPRALMGYGFVFFILMWLMLQKRFKIKLRKFA
ncbi:O-antigen polymerase [Flagellimonas pacifica]|nr:O-antigen polymerase [Allomuricauda parva]